MMGDVRRVSAVFMACMYLLPGGAAIGDEPIHEFTVTLQNGSDYHGSADDSAGPTIQLSVNRKDRAASGTLLKFGHLGEFLRGEGIEITDAHLDLFYKDETWTLIRYKVAVFRSIDGTVSGVPADPEGYATVTGDKWPPGERTALKNWISIPLRSSTVQKWLADESLNHGLVLTVDSAEMGPEQAKVHLALSDKAVGGPFVGFGANDGPAKERPRLVIRYRVNGNVAPEAPRLAESGPGAMLASPILLSWAPARDPDSGEPIGYQFQAGYRLGAGIEWAGSPTKLREPRFDWDIRGDQSSLYSGSGVPASKQLMWYRVRSVDSRGATSRWVISGPFRVASRRWSIWVLDGNRKVWSDSDTPDQEARRIRIHAARNEWESFQVAVDVHVAVKGLHITASAFSGPGGGTLPAPSVYREHFVPIEETANRTYGHVGVVPDALVPLSNPETGGPTGGLYGGDHFDIVPGGRAVFWFDNFVPAGAAPGVYRGTVLIEAEGMAPEIAHVELEVWDFDLPSTKHLVACFQMDESSVAKSHGLKPDPQGNNVVRTLAHRYEAMLHEHYISNWSPITGFNYGLNGVRVTVEDDVVSTDWSAFDDVVEPYMNGTAFADGVPSQCLFVPYWLPTPSKDGDGWAPKLTKFNYDKVRYDLFGQFVRQMQDHLEAKGWLDRSYVFYFDEPFISQWKYSAYIETAKVIRRSAPRLRILLTDGYRGPGAYEDKGYITEPIESYVDVWDPVTFQVSSPEIANYYRQRKRDGKFDMWCQTLANANPGRAVINLFPEYDMPFHRMWGVLSWSLGFQGIEWWQTIVWWDVERKRRIDPWTEATAFPGFRQPLNGDGRLFYPGHQEAVGAPDIPIGTLRMKAVREAIEDYEYLHLLQQSGAASHFDLERLYTFDRDRAEEMRAPMPMGKGPWHWWEGDADAMMAARREIAALIVKARNGASGQDPD